MRPKQLLVGCATITVLGLVALIGLHRLAGPFRYSADDVRGTIIDEETQQPLEGAVVVGIWKLETIGGYRGRVLHASEALTDRQGRYVLQGFGPRRRPLLEWFTVHDPWIVVYKPGFRYTGATNDSAYVPVYTRKGSRVHSRPLPDGRILQVGGEYSKAAKRFCYWNGKTIALRRATPRDAKEAAENFELVMPWDEWRLPLARQMIVAAQRNASAQEDPRDRDTSPGNDTSRQTTETQEQP